ncbi:MAG: efflux RND transporter periplasmic adaptor subunit [Candidatus Rickettsia vulgarisii]
MKSKNITQPLLLTGEIAAKNETSLSFRVDGKLIERSVSLGDKVTANQIIAKLDPQDIKDSLTTAKSNLTAAEAVLKQASSKEARQKALYEKQYATKAQYDKVVQQLQSAKSQVEAAKATLNQVRSRLNYTDLRSDVAGTVTKTFADAGEVIRSGEAIVKIATDEGLDAVFNVPEKLFQRKLKDLPIEVSLSYNPSIKASGIIRQVSPQADPVTRTFIVKVLLTNPPKEMKLWSTVIGSVISDDGSNRIASFCLK